MAEKKEKLFTEFPPVSTDEWMAKAVADLKGADFEKRLVWRTNEGFKLKPFHRREDLEGLKTIEALPGEFPYLRGNKAKSNEWLIRQERFVEDAAEANKKALYILDRGINSLGFHISDDRLIEKEQIATLLKDIVADCVELNFIVRPGQCVTLAKNLKEYFTEKGYDLGKLEGSIDYDFINDMLDKGTENGDPVQVCRSLIDTLSEMPRFKVINIHGISLCNAGAYITQELGYALAWGQEYLHLLTEAGVPADVVAKRIKFHLGVCPNYFLEIGKFRAAKMLWAMIVQTYIGEQEMKQKADAAKMHIHAETSTFNLTVYDDYVNLLRTQTEAMSAVLGGIDSMTVLPFDITYQQPGDFSERLARNQQLLLKEESHFDKVVDPAAGSYYIETVTKDIAEQAWKIFLEVEAKGGFYSQVKAGEVQQAINNSNEQRHQAVARRKEILLGTNQFPNFTEQAGDKTPIEEQVCAQHQGEETQIPTLKFHLAATEFENLRLQTERSGKRPKAFMLTIGNLAMRQARAQFSCNFLACAGYEVIDNLGFETVEQGVEAAMKANADIVVICSSDDEYATYAIPAFKELNNRALFIVAGNPACTEELKAAGIEHFIHVKVNVLETLRNFNEMLLKK